jgi:hypothetical protein
MFANSDVTIGVAVSSWMCSVTEHPPMLPGQSKVELYAALRRDSRDGMSNRALQCKYGVTWSTVNKALTSGLVAATHENRFGAAVEAGSVHAADRRAPAH